MINPEMVFFPSYMIVASPLTLPSPHRGRGRDKEIKRFSTEIGRSFLFPFQHQCISNEFMNTRHLNSRHPVLQERWKGCPINRTDTGQQVPPVLLLPVPAG